MTKLLSRVFLIVALGVLLGVSIAPSSLQAAPAQQPDCVQVIEQAQNALRSARRIDDASVRRTTDCLRRSAQTLTAKTQAAPEVVATYPLFVASILPAGCLTFHSDGTLTGQIGPFDLTGTYVGAPGLLAGFEVSGTFDPFADLSAWGLASGAGLLAIGAGTSNESVIPIFFTGFPFPC